MENKFNGFYSPNTDELKLAWESEQTLFVFDTNIFLNLYSYGENTRNDFFGIIEKLKDNIWIPYHVGLEYQRRRLTIIKNEKAIFEKINEYLLKIENTLNNEINQLGLEKRFPKLNENKIKLEKEINKSISNFKKSLMHWDTKQPCVRSHDIIRSKINCLFKNNVGEKPKDQKVIDDIEKKGEERFKNLIPPGFKDVSKGKQDNPCFVYDGIKYQRKFGDLILWQQMIEEAKKDNIKNVIFITDDSKGDWWYIIDSRGKKNIGPHANLRSEIMNESNIELFHMYNLSSFLEDGEINLGIKLNENSIEETENLFETRLFKNFFSSDKEKLKTINKYLQSLEDENTSDKLKNICDIHNEYIFWNNYENEKLKKSHWFDIYNSKSIDKEKLIKFLKEEKNNDKIKTLLSEFEDENVDFLKWWSINRKND